MYFASSGVGIVHHAYIMCIGDGIDRSDVIRQVGRSDGCVFNRSPEAPSVYGPYGGRKD